MTRTILAAACVVTITLTNVSAQSWNSQPPVPAVSFGLSGDLLGRIPQGLVGFDEVQAATVLPLAGAWVTLAASVPARSSSTLANPNPAVYIFGGLEPVSGQLLNDVWRYNPMLGDWQMLTAGGSAALGPSPRLGCKAAPFDNSVVVLFFGGSDANGLPSDTWVMLPTTTAPSPPFWVQQPTPPGMLGRIGHCMARAPGGQVILFGGTNGTVLGDTWLYDLNGWVQHVGIAPPAAVDCRMAYDPGRDMTVLVHPNGDTWEWNGFRWRRVGAVGAPTWSSPATVFEQLVAPGVGGNVIAVQPLGGATATYRYVASPANFDLTLDATCNVPGMQGLQLAPFERSLPIVGETFHMRVIGVPPASLLLGAYELEIPGVPMISIGCGCMLTLLGSFSVVEFLPYSGGPRDWWLPIANVPALVGASIAIQAFVVDNANPCWLMSTQSGRMTPGL